MSRSAESRTLAGRRRRPSRAAVVRAALWLALMVAAAGVALLTGELGAGLIAAGGLTALVLYFVVNVDSEPPAAV